MLGDQIIKRIEFCHARGFVHRDIKPENFCIGHGSYGQKELFLIDFGLSKAYRDLKSGNHIQMMSNCELVGTI